VKRLALAAILMPAAAFAGDGMLGTRTDVAPTSSGSPVGVMPMIQMLVALAIVAGLVKYVLPRVLNRVAKPASEGDIAVEATTALGAGTLHIVRARGRTLLIGATPAGMSCLADLTETEAPLAAPTTTPTTTSKPVSFEEMLAAATVATPEPAPGRPVDDVALALERLRALED
jgi:flagellar biogenesis protein FliO